MMSSTTEIRRDPADDVAWIRETLAGNEAAFGNLVRKYKDQLYELACRILGSRTEAEDVLQDAFIEAYRHLKDFHHRSRFSTWLYSIVLNRIRNRLRQGKVLRWYSLDIRRATRDGFRPPEMPEHGPTVDTMAEKKIELETIQRAVKTFPLHYQSIFILHYFHNTPLEEVAQKLGRPLGTVKVYLHRARKLLYKRLTARARLPISRREEADLVASFDPMALVEASSRRSR
jgi:RNA polymerase sigma-70 factor (ECF subfamily)